MNYALQTLAYVVGLAIVGAGIGAAIKRREHREGRK